MSDSSDPELDLSQVSGFKVSVSGKGQLDPDFFPLQVGTEWNYELVYLDSSVWGVTYSSLQNLTISVTGTQTDGGDKSDQVKCIIRRDYAIL